MEYLRLLWRRVLRRDGRAVLPVLRQAGDYIVNNRSKAYSLDRF